jgi:16S rRNA (adenine1518-N6/adenine1519-N6)-dimethyltransferase
VSRPASARGLRRGKRPAEPDRGTRRGPRARKRFGQHFLEPPWVAKLIESLSPQATDTFLEIGPGRGALTRPLAARVGRVVAVEIDRDLAALLPAGLPAHARVVTGDFLDVDLESLVGGEPKPIRVVGNLPYNVASPMLFKLLKSAGEGRVFSDATLMLQKEVADRLVARPGTSDYGSLSIQTALLADVTRVMTLPPGAFRPPPKVTSAVVHLTFRPPPVDVGDAAVFERLVRGIFLQRRKTLVNALKPVAESFGRPAAEIIARAQVDRSRRPDALSLEDMARLSRAVL